ncbi:EAL domain-containing protein [Alkaliphilus transvaalensis]|uniref:EAL domain-containing protein n=1 Tax=Alkaliphilus transvaalensis TaxID=114628 RepID=UPI00047BA58E|nr:EAL domain-containing protein [Alkaliphilus transvaalensis]
MAIKQNKNNDLLIYFDDFTLILKNGSRLASNDTEGKQNYFKLNYYPIYETREGICCYEFLLQRADSEGNIDDLGDITQIIKDTNIISQIDYWTIQQAIDMLMVRKNISLFVNVSIGSLSFATIITDIEKSIIVSGINPKRLNFRVRKDPVKNMTVDNIEGLMSLKKLGCSFI